MATKFLLIDKEFNKALEIAKAKKINKMLADLADATPVDTGYAKSRWSFNGKSIINDADYIDGLNEGTSRQAPAFFIEQTLLSQEGVKPDGTIVRSL